MKSPRNVVQVIPSPLLHPWHFGGKKYWNENKLYLVFFFRNKRRIAIAERWYKPTHCVRYYKFQRLTKTRHDIGKYISAWQWYTEASQWRLQQDRWTESYASSPLRLLRPLPYPSIITSPSFSPSCPLYRSLSLAPPPLSLSQPLISRYLLSPFLHTHIYIQ